MSVKTIKTFFILVFLSGIMVSGVMAQQGDRVKVSEADKQRMQQLANEQAEATKRMEAEKQRAQATAKDKKTVKQVPLQNKPRIDDSTLKPGEIIPREISVSQPPKQKGNSVIR